MHSPIDARSLLPFLGHSPSSEEFDAWLEEHRVFERPHNPVFNFDDDDKALDKKTKELIALALDLAAERDGGVGGDHDDDDDDEDDEDDEDDDPRAAMERARDSEIEDVERDSLSLIYENQEDYELLFDIAESDGDFIFKQVAFYAKGVQGYPGHQCELPLGLKFEMSQDAVHALLGAPLASRQVYELLSDLYYADKIKEPTQLIDWIINISYLDQGASIGIVHVRPAHMYDISAFDDRTYRGVLDLDDDPNPDAVKLDVLMACLGRSAYEPQLEALLDSVDWRRKYKYRPMSPDAVSVRPALGPVGVELPDILGRGFYWGGRTEANDAVACFGLAMYYRDAKDYPMLAGPEFVRDGAVFAGFRVNRRGDLHSEGYDGALPFDMKFYHSPEQLIACVGREPDWKSVSDGTGAYRWKFADFTMQVMFSLIDYQLYRVWCYAAFLNDELFPER